MATSSELASASHPLGHIYILISSKAYTLKGFEFMLVLHSIWDGERLSFWAESSALPLTATEGLRKRKKELLKTQQTQQTHPFALSGGETKLQLERQFSDIFRRSNSRVESLTLRLPSTKKAPLPSPWLLLDDPILEKAAGLQEWTVEALTFDPGSALDLLIDMPTHPPQGTAFGDSIRFWSDLALFSLELVAREQFVPTIRAGKASWAAVIDEDDYSRLGAFFKAIPPSCRGFLTYGSGSSAGSKSGPTAGSPAPSPKDLIMSFIDSAVDSFVRCSLKDAQLLPVRRGRRPSVVPLAQQLLQALSSEPEESSLKASAEDLDSFSNDLQSWLSRLQPSAEDVPYRTCFRLEPPQEGYETEAWTVRFFLQAKDDRSLLVPAEEVWRTRSQALTFLKRRLKNPQEQLLADLGKATRIFPQLEQSLQRARPVNLKLETEEAYSFLRQFAPLLEQNGFGVLLPTWWEKPGSRLGVRLKLKSPGPVSSPIAQGLFGLNALVDYDWELALGDRTLTEAEFTQLASLKVPLVQLRGEWVELPVEEIEAAIEFFKKHGNKEITLGSALKLGLNTGSETKLEGKSGLPVVGVAAEGWIEDLLKSLSGPGGGQLKPIGTPQGFKGHLRPYQAKGVSWLEYLNRFGLGACLADDMGLGKTIELIAFLLHEREGDSNGNSNSNGLYRPTLLICPMSVAGNWQREFERFAPSMKVMVHHGTDRLSGRLFEDEAFRQDVVITTYSLAQRDEEDLSTIQWGHIVLDEAQNIKNQSARQTRAIKRLKGGQRIALTGTPVENRLSELWSIMDFLNPEYLGSAESFRRDFVLPIERHKSKERSEMLRGIIQPFVLRRLKTDPTIINDLPEKMVMLVSYNLTPEQASLYAAVVDEMLGKIEQARGIERKGQILSALTKLKQICNHPALFLQDGSPLVGRSGKLIRMEEMLYEVMAEGERALIFTQFAGMGAMLRHYLQEKLGCEVLFLHGGTPKKQRDGMIQKFQSGGVPLFILSLKAGGLGLNLTAANHVFHFDRWWNPAVENQATDRVFRIGQKKNVFVHKFVCLGTLEERIDQMIEGKKALAESVIGTGEAWLTELSNDALKDLLSLHREAVYNEGNGSNGGNGGD
jgi:SNF2 family DNA or RNA helicase